MARTTSLDGLRTIKEIAAGAGADEHRVRYVVASRGLAAARTVGATRLYAPDVVRRIRRNLEAADVLRAR